MKLTERKTPLESTVEDLEMMNTAFKEHRKALESDSHILEIVDTMSSPIDLLLQKNEEETTQFKTKVGSQFRYRNVWTF